MIIVPNVYYDKFDDVLLHWYNDGQIWYKFYDIASMFGYGENDMGEVWKRYINENDKVIFEEEYTDLRGNIRTNEYKYINTVALFNLCDRYERVIGKIRRHARKIEIENGFAKENDDNNHILKVNLGIMEQCLKANDHGKLAEVSEKVLQSQYIQQIRYGDPIKEELINHFRVDVYEYDDDIEEVEWTIKMTKKPNVDNEEERKSKYKRFKEQGGKSSCPSWLKDVIK